MPIDQYDKYFGAKKGSAHRALEELVKEYGLKKGTQIFYAMKNERKKAGKTYGTHGKRR